MTMGSDLSKRVYRELLLSMYTGKSFGTRADLKDMEYKGSMQKYSFMFTISLLSIAGGILGKFTGNYPQGFTILFALVVLYTLNIGVNVVYYVHRKRPDLILMTLPLSQREVTYSLVSGVLSFFDMSFLGALLIPPLLTYLLSGSTLQAAQVTLEMSTAVALSILLIFLTGRDASSTSVGVSIRLLSGVFIFGIFLFLTVGNPNDIRAFPTVFVLVYPFPFGEKSLPLSLSYALLSALGALIVVQRWTSYLGSIVKSLDYDIRALPKALAWMGKDLKAVAVLPQENGLLVSPALGWGILYITHNPLDAVSYTVLLTVLGSGLLIASETGGFPTLLAVPGGLRQAVVYKSMVSLLFYIASLALLGTISVGAVEMGAFIIPGVVSSYLISVFLSVKSIVRGKGIGVFSPIEVMVRSAETLPPSLVSLYLYSLSPVASLLSGAVALSVVVWIILRDSTLREN